VAECLLPPGRLGEQKLTEGTESFLRPLLDVGLGVDNNDEVQSKLSRLADEFFMSGDKVSLIDAAILSSQKMFCCFLPNLANHTNDQKLWLAWSLQKKNLSEVRANNTQANKY